MAEHSLVVVHSPPAGVGDSPAGVGVRILVGAVVRNLVGVGVHSLVEGGSLAVVGVGSRICRVVDLLAVDLPSMGKDKKRIHQIKNQKQYSALLFIRLFGQSINLCI